MAAAQNAGRRSQFHAVAAGFLGWTLDAFDFFVVVFLFDSLAAQFHVSKGDIIATVSWTLLMRPVGAVIFGLLTDRYGRRIPLIANVVFFSVVELLCGFAPNYTVFFILRILYGIGISKVDFLEPAQVESFRAEQLDGASGIVAYGGFVTSQTKSARKRRQGVGIIVDQEEMSCAGQASGP